MFILTRGDAYNGFDNIGPFTSGDEARRYKRQFRLDAAYRVAKVKAPDPAFHGRPDKLALVRRDLSTGYGVGIP